MVSELPFLFSVSDDWIRKYRENVWKKGEGGERSAVSRTPRRVPASRNRKTQGKRREGEKSRRCSR